MNSNTILITGGGTGIGRGLAEAFHKLGNQVIISGRTETVLKEVCAANPGMHHNVLDVADGAAIQNAARRITKDFPSLNVVINNAGVQIGHDFSSDVEPDDGVIEAEIATNLLGVIRTALAFLAHLKKQPGATMVNVTSGLAYVPLFRTPVYCATKAAVHSFTMSLRMQLAGSGVSVVELVPPRVGTNLGGGRNLPFSMPVDVFVDEAMRGLAAGTDEVGVGMARDLMAMAGTDAVKQRMTQFGR
jgi:uncharacterized oxidoreductase